MQIKFKKLNENAKLPIYATKNSSGMDLSACIDESVCLHAGESAIVPTGVAIELPDGLEAQIRGHAGLAFRHAIFCFQDTVDADNGDEVKVLLTNQSKKDFVIKPGVKVAQLVVVTQPWRGETEFESVIDIEYPLAKDSKSIRALDRVMEDHIPPQFRKGAPDQSEIMGNLLNAGRGK